MTLGRTEHRWQDLHFTAISTVLAADQPVVLTHGLQSVKLIDRGDRHDPALYGAVTVESIGRLEVSAGRPRVNCMAITADGRDRGRPSSWSAAIDELAAGVGTDIRRLIVISAGNTNAQSRRHYPGSNETELVQDPAQAWNALTVGGTTEKVLIDQQHNAG